jgi:NTP pyrophosphatase (non-canonical NTP hydrolase)
MDLTTYQEHAQRTMGTQYRYPIQHLAVAALGLAGESVEVLEAVGVATGEWTARRDNVLKELGDVLWYAAYLATQCELDLGSITLAPPSKATRKDTLALNLVKVCGHTADFLKKVIGHGHDLDKARVTESLALILSYLQQLATHKSHSSTLGEVGEKNIAKLKLRYPDGFSEEASKARVDV